MIETCESCELDFNEGLEYCEDCKLCLCYDCYVKPCDEHLAATL